MKVGEERRRLGEKRIKGERAMMRREEMMMRCL